jgi:hypothetical protein
VRCLKLQHCGSVWQGWRLDLQGLLRGVSGAVQEAVIFFFVVSFGLVEPSILACRDKVHVGWVGRAVWVPGF